MKLPKGIPSHDTFGRVFAAMNPVEIEHEGISHSYAKTVNKDHGHTEIRLYWKIYDPAYLANLRDLKRRTDNQNLVMILYEHPTGEDYEVQDCYLISGLKSNTEKILQARRSGWGIENRLN